MHRAARTLPAALLPGAGALLAALLAVAGGCAGPLGAAAYYLGPPRVQKAEFTFGPGPVGILVDTARPTEESPLFERDLHAKLAEVFRERKVSQNVVPFERTLRLAADHPDFYAWDLQRVGRALGAEQVLAVRIDELRVRESPDHPLVSPFVKLRLKVVATGADPAHARLWPDSPDGRAVEVARPPEEYVSIEQADAAMSLLAHDAAQLVARHFYDVDLEERTPRAR